MDDILFAVKDLHISAPQCNGSETPIVKGVSFQVKRGQVVALIGESGSGKTTISLSALGYCKPGLKFTGGKALFLGQDVTRMSTLELRPLRGERVAYLAQSAIATFNPSLRINEQVTEAPVVHGTKTQAEADARALELYRALELPNPETIGNRYPHQVSGGQLQRLMAAMALCGNADLLVLDEPTTALDVTTQIEVLKAFKKVIKDEGAAAIYVTHDLAVVAQIADYIVVLYNGEIKEKGPVEAVINNPQHPYTKRLMAAVRPAPGAGQGEAIAMGLTQTPTLTTQAINAGYGRLPGGGSVVQVLTDVNLEVGKGQTLGIIGESGSGKSTLARVIAGLLAASDGTILLNGKTLPPALSRRSKAQLQKVQFVYQMADTALNPRQKVGEILGRPMQFYAGIKGAAQKLRVAELLEMVKLPAAIASRYPYELSGGQKQRVNLARALAAEPEIILCDEVTSALDCIVGANIISLLEELRIKTNVSSIFISHDLSTVASFAHEIAVLFAGRIIEKGPTDLVLEPPFHPYTKLLIDSVPELKTDWLEQRQHEDNGGNTSGPLTSGCPFHLRCPIAIQGLCGSETPPKRSTGDGHEIWCHHDISVLSYCGI